MSSAHAGVPGLRRRESRTAFRGGDRHLGQSACQNLVRAQQPRVHPDRGSEAGVAVITAVHEFDLPNFLSFLMIERLAERPDPP